MAQQTTDYELPRIGKTVDSLEILYFNLFPSLKNCRSATYKIDNFGNLAFKVLMASGQFENAIVSKASIPEFEKFILQFENKFEEETEMNWSNLPEYKNHRFKNYEGKGVWLTVSTFDGMFEGEFLYSDTNTLYLWNKDDYYDFAFFDKSIRKIPIQNIDKISVKQNLSNRLAFGTVGLGLGIAYSAISYSFDQIGSNAGTVLSITLGASYLGSLVGEIVDLISNRKREIFVYGDLEPFLKFQRRYYKNSMFPNVAPPELR